ncbi:MAG TPA: hypothetical protein VLB80_03720 [Candidatus Babeliales bacterium]|nr:hypothetical protein [Candidatus Babeliales bacterium]
MQNFVQNRWCIGLIGLLFLYRVSIFTMDINYSNINEDPSNKPVKTITLFSPCDAVKQGELWSKVVPGSFFMAPDGTSIIMGYHGMVKFIGCNSSGDNNASVIMQHPCVRHIPMIALAQRKDKSLLIVSAGNYIDGESAKRVSEYYVFVNKCFSMNKLELPIQAIALDPVGEVLAIAHDTTYTIIDLVNKNHDAYFFTINNKDNLIADLALNISDNALSVAGMNKGIQLMTFSKTDNSLKLSDPSLFFQMNDAIKKIHYPNNHELLYVTYEGEVKIINIYDFFINNTSDATAYTFAFNPLYDQVVFDQRKYIATAHWTNNIRVDQQMRCKVEVFCKEKDSIKKVILEAPNIEKSYNYITELGNREVGISHLLHVALSGKYVAALATDGKIRVWYLDECNSISNAHNNIQTMGDKNKVEPVVYRQENYFPVKKDLVDTSSRKLSQFQKAVTIVDAPSTDDHVQDQVEDNKKDTKLKKPSSPRIIKVLATRSSKNNSGGSKEDSPENSPRKKNNTSNSDLIQLKNYESKK